MNVNHQHKKDVIWLKENLNWAFNVNKPLKSFSIVHCIKYVGILFLPNTWIVQTLSMLVLKCFREVRIEELKIGLDNKFKEIYIKINYSESCLCSTRSNEWDIIEWFADDLVLFQFSILSFFQCVEFNWWFDVQCKNVFITLHQDINNELFK